MALAGLHPVVAVYATFLNRAFDQVLLDVALHRCGVTFVLDRAGVTGDDGPSHNGMWDMSMLQLVPGLRLAAPRDGAQLRELLREAVQVDDAPTVVRFAKGAVPDDLPAVERVGVADVMSRDDDPEVFVLAVGSLVGCAAEAADIARRDGARITVVDPRWVKPFDPAVVELAAQHQLVVTLEDNGRQGGVGAAFTQALRDAGSDVAVRVHGVEQEFLDHAKRDVILDRLGLTPQAIADDIAAARARNKPGAARR
jgi:1-deoxy-D-xylulose-5-phosphate synthase